MASKVSAVRPTAAQRGYGSRWQKASRTFLARGANRLCACGCGQPATVVDHKKPHRGDPRLFWDTSNWQGLSKGCHDSMKQRIERNGYSDRLDVNGLPTDPRHPFNRPEPE